MAGKKLKQRKLKPAELVNDEMEFRKPFENILNVLKMLVYRKIVLRRQIE